MDLGEPAGEQSGSATSSAFRWLRGPGKTDDNTESPRRRLAGAALARAKSADQDDDDDQSDDGDELELTQELELTMSVEAETPTPPMPTKKPAQEIKSAAIPLVATAPPKEPIKEPVRLKTEPPEDPLPLSAFDDDDDIDDFDDLGDLEHALQPARFEPADRLSNIDLRELAPQRTIAQLSAALEEPVIEPEEPVIEPKRQRIDPAEQSPSSGNLVLESLSSDQPMADEQARPEVRLSSDVETNEQPPAIEAGTNDPEPPAQAAAPTAMPTPAVDELTDDLPKVTLRKAALEQHVPADAVDETKAQSGSNGLALQPIPELQSGMRPSSDNGSAQKSVLTKDAQTAAMQADASEISDASDLNIEPITTDPVDEPRILPSKTDFPLIDDLQLLLDDVDDTPPPEDQPVSEDMLADIANALSVVDSEASIPAEALDAALAVIPTKASEPALKDLPLGKPSQIVPLSSTLTELAVETEPSQGDDGEDVLVPPLSIKPQDRSAIAESQQAVAAVVPTLPAMLSTEERALAIIAQVPRLRRFAAAQIGDEQEADRLVGTTAQSVLTDPTVLGQAEDQNLAMLMMLCRRRQSDLSGAARLARSASSAKAFQTTLCAKLVGADQFEIHQFAQAINLIDEEDRTLLLLAALEGLSYEQIATIVQRPVGQVMLRLAEARMGLRQALNAEEGKEQPLAEAHPREIEIHGYLDGELDQRHMAEMDSLVEHDRDAADRLLHYGIQGDLIRRIYAPLLNRPIAQEMLATFSTAFRAKPDEPVKRGFFRSARLALFAGAIVMVLGAGVVTWMVPSLASAVSDAMTVSSLTPVRSSGTDKSQKLAAATSLGR